MLKKLTVQVNEFIKSVKILPILYLKKKGNKINIKIIFKIKLKNLFK